MRVMILIVLTAFICGCAQTSAVMVDSSKQYQPTEKVLLLTEAPSRPYISIAVLESTGPVNTPLPDLLESMKKKGMAIGADAVIPMQDVSTTQQQGIMYNPWLGGYQTIGGGTLPKIRGVAIKFTE